MTLDRSRIAEYFIYLLTPAFFLGKSYKIIAALVVIFFLIDTIKHKHYYVFKDTIFLILTSWCSYLFLSSLWATHPLDSLRGSGELFLWILLYLSIRSTLVTQKKIELFIKFQAIVVIFVSANSLMQFIIGFNIFGVSIEIGRVTDLLDGRRTIGHLLPIWIALFGAVLASEMKNKRFYLLCAAALVGLLITLPLTGTRGPLVIMAIFLPLIAWMSPFRKQAFIALGMLLVFVSCLVATTPELQKRLETLAHPFEDQKHYRIPIWLTSLEEFKDNPILGVGFCNYRYRVFDYYQDSFESYEINPKEGKTQLHSHNPWMDILSEQGLVGVAFALTLLIFIARQAYKVGILAVIGSMGVWYTFSLLNSTFVLSSDRWSFFIIVAIIFYSIVVKFCEIQKLNSMEFK